MTIAKTVEGYLHKHQIPYTIVPHTRTLSSRETAQAAHVPAERIAKAVILTDNKGYMMVVVPSNTHIGLDMLSKLLGRKLSLATETRLVPVFMDCEPGAIPPLGEAYGMETMLDESLAGQPEIFFEAGDHKDLIRIDGDQFMMLMKNAHKGHFCH